MFEYAPDVGPYADRIADLARQLESDSELAISQLTDTAMEESKQPPSLNEGDSDWAKYLFATSVLLDVVRAGGRVGVRDSRVMVSWPDWEGKEGRELASRAMTAAMEMRRLRADELQRVSPLFARDTHGGEVAQALREGRFWLESVDNVHPSGVPYSEGFAAALRLWTMPYRGRQGRVKRFVVLCQHDVFGPHPVIAGIIEMGDEAPFCPWRDRLLGLETSAFLTWLRSESDAGDWALKIAGHLRGIRGTLHRTRGGLDLRAADAAMLVAKRSRLESQAAGRSQTGDRLRERKRQAYALRLARGEAALHTLGTEPTRIHDIDDKLRSELSAGVRAVHDIVLPRVHLEATVCGPVAPFSHGLGGKLIIAFLAHPEILSLPSGSVGSILEQSFDLEALTPFLPHEGMLALTTKGLYARHAPMYNRSSVPGISAELRLERVHETEGTTTTLTSQRTATLARAVLALIGESEPGRQVSLVYGAGGAKRHRTLESAAKACHLDERALFAGIRRPVYAVRFAANPEAVIWTGADPEWSVGRHLPANEYSDRAVDLWRRRWLGKAIDRIVEYGFIPSPTRNMGENP